MTELDLPRIQGLVIRGYSFPFAKFWLLRIDDEGLPDSAASVGTWLAQLLPDIQTAQPWAGGARPDGAINIGFSFSGLSVLGLPDSALIGFPEEFRQGMKARADRLGDNGASSPARWQEPYGSTDVHILLMMYGDTEEVLQARQDRLRAGLDGAGLRIIHEESGATLPHNGEHFGFADGFGQPALVGSGVAPRAGQGAMDGNGWRPIGAGEFVMGYPDEEGIVAPAPAPAELSVNSTYLVFRKISQDVPGFRRQMAEAAADFPGGVEALSAKVVGRWTDGTPVALSPQAMDPPLARNAKHNNDFDYTDDPIGLKCPVGAHIRRANPRGSLPFAGKLVNRHRMIRRGIPYGGPMLAPDAGDDGRDRGLLFISLQSSIVRQFEFVQSQWMNGGNALALGTDQDPLVGQQDGDPPVPAAALRGKRTGTSAATTDAKPPPAKMTIPGQPPYFMGPLQSVTTVRGGEYFFVPGMNGLQYLAAAAGGGMA